MAGRPLTHTVAGIAIAAVLLAAAVEVQAVRERRYPPAEEDREALYVTSGNALRRLAVAYQSVAADLYWMRAIQYFGGSKQRLEAQPPPVNPSAGHEFDLLYPMLDITTTLDPRFNIAYRFGAIFLAEAYPAGPGRPDLAIKLLEKGLRERPDKWEYMEDMGFVHYWWRHDNLAAAAWFDRASKAPGAPNWLKPLAATTLVKGGDRRSSRTMWLAIRQSAEVAWLRNSAEHRLAQLDALDQIDALQAAVDRATIRLGRPPADWPSLVRAGMLRGIPVDPTGTPYELTDARVRLSSSSTLYPLPQEPASRPQPAS